MPDPSLPLAVICSNLACSALHADFFAAASSAFLRASSASLACFSLAAFAAAASSSALRLSSSPCARPRPPSPSVRLPPPWPAARSPRAALRLPRRRDPVRPVRPLPGSRPALGFGGPGLLWLRAWRAVRPPRAASQPPLPRPPWPSRGFRRPGAALVFFALLRRRLFGPALLRLALRFLRGLARRLPLGARLLLALLGGLLQEVDALLRVDRQRRIREAPDESLQRGRIGRVLYPVPLQRFLRRRLAARATAAAGSAARLTLPCGSRPRSGRARDRHRSRSGACPGTLPRPASFRSSEPVRSRP